MNLLATIGQQYEIIAGTGIAETKSVTFDNDGSGSVGNLTLFHTTGMVGVKIYARGIESLRGASATIEVGTSTNTAGLIAQTTATALLADEIWHDNSPDATLELSSVSTDKIITRDIVLTIATADVTGGAIEFVAVWRPLSNGANLVAATTASSASPSLSPSASVSRSASPSLSPSSSASASLSISPSSSASPSSSVSPSASVSRSLSPSSSVSPSASESQSLSPSASKSASLSPSASASRSLSPSASASASLSPSTSKSPSASPSRSLSPSSSTSPSASVSPSASGL
jgi:hypothetical protein